MKKYFADPALPVGPIHHQLLPPSHPVTAYLASGRDTPDSTHGFVLLIDTPSLFSWKSDDLAILKETIEILEHKSVLHRVAVNIWPLTDDIAAAAIPAFCTSTPCRLPG